MNDLNLIKYIGLLLLVTTTGLILASCMDEGPPVLPGLEKSTLSVITYPEQATVLLNNKILNKSTPVELPELEPGFYRIDFRLQNYLDTTYYYLIKRGVADSILVEMREDPDFWWEQYRRETHPLPTNSFNRVRIDSNGVKYICSSNYGLIIYDNAAWVNYNKANSPMPSNIVNDVIKTGNILWIATDAGLVRFDGSNWIIYNKLNANLPSDYITSLCIDQNNVFWLGTYTNGLVRFDGSSFTTYNTENSHLPHNNISMVYISSDNLLWGATYGGGVFSFNGINFTIYNYLDNGLVTDYVRDITEDKEGTIWAASGTHEGFGGLSQIKNARVTNLTWRNSGLTGSIFTSIIFDKYNNLWVTAPQVGLLFRQGTQWRVYNPSNSGIPAVTAYNLAIDIDGTKWVISEGLSRYLGFR